MVAGHQGLCVTDRSQPPDSEVSFVQVEVGMGWVALGICLGLFPGDGEDRRGIDPLGRNQARQLGSCSIENPSLSHRRSCLVLLT